MSSRVTLLRGLQAMSETPTFNRKGVWVQCPAQWIPIDAHGEVSGQDLQSVLGYPPSEVALADATVHMKPDGSSTDQASLLLEELQEEDPTLGTRKNPIKLTGVRHVVPRPDLTREWLQSLPLVESVPDFDDLERVFNKGLVRPDGTTVRLPVTDEVYHTLLTDVRDWVEPASLTQAWQLGAAVAAALTSPVLQFPCREPTLTSILLHAVDKLFAFMAEAFSRALTRTYIREENTHLLLADRVVMFKMEGTRTDMEDVRHMQYWSTRMDAEMDYMLCAAPKCSCSLQLAVLKGGNRQQVHWLEQSVDMTNPEGIAIMMHRVIIAFGIIRQQLKLLQGYDMESDR